MQNESRKSFHQELEEIREDIARLGSMASERVTQATEALFETNLEDAQRIIDEDDEVDALALEIEEKCQSVLLLQNPVAGDLRAVISALWIVGELERSADLASNICKANRRILGYEIPSSTKAYLALMSDEAIRLLNLAADAYYQNNEGLASALEDIDDRLDGLHIDFLEGLFKDAEGGSGEVQPVVQMALIGRYYERIGDHAVNIGERVSYMVSGRLPEDTGRARIEYKEKKSKDE